MEGGPGRASRALAHQLLCVFLWLCEWRKKAENAAETSAMPVVSFATVTPRCAGGRLRPVQGLSESLKRFRAAGLHLCSCHLAVPRPPTCNLFLVAWRRVKGKRQQAFARAALIVRLLSAACGELRAVISV